MTMLRLDLKKMFPTVVSVAVFFLIITIDHPILYVLCWAYFILGLALSIFGKIKSKINPPSNEIRFPMQNDSFGKTTAITLGLMVVISTVAWMLVTAIVHWIPLALLLTGSLIFISGMIDLPGGDLTIENNELIVSELKQKIHLSNIKSFKVDEEHLEIDQINNHRVSVNKLDLDEEQIKMIRLFIQKKIDQRTG